MNEHRGFTRRAAPGQYHRHQQRARFLENLTRHV
jgi:hypothetical protein